MNKEGYADVSFVLLLVPFIGSAIYALILWIRAGPSFILPESVYLAVTKDPYLFIVGFTSVMFACAIEIATEEPSLRGGRLATLGRRIQSLAIVSLVLSLLAAWYATGFLHIGSTIVDFLDGRFTILFSGLLILFSFIILPSARIGPGRVTKLVAVLCFLAVPGVVYEVGKRSVPIGLVLAVVLILIGIFLTVRAKK